MNRLTTEHDIAPRYLGVRQVLIDAALAYELGCDYKRVLQIGSYGKLGREKKFLENARKMSHVGFDRVVGLLANGAEI